MNDIVRGRFGPLRRPLSVLCGAVAFVVAVLMLISPRPMPTVFWGSAAVLAVVSVGLWRAAGRETRRQR